MHLTHCVLILFMCMLVPISSEESQFSINNNKAVQLVNERFISFSVDPAVFFARLPHRDILFKLITNLSPAYLRLVGPSTQFLDFSADERKATRVISDETTALTFSPAMWWSLNEWMQKTNFTPIFGINDAAHENDEKWDAKGILPLLDMTAKMNVNCLWQLGFDCSQKGYETYKEDLKEFRKIVSTFPEKKAKWQIVGSDLSKCTPTDHAEILRMYLADLENADAIIWEEDESIVSNFLSGGVMENLLGFHQATVPVWLSTPKSQHPIGFEDGINWAVELGEAARKGFAVIFREPRLQEYYSATPAYWVTVLHKSLMGRNVLEVKSTSFAHSDARIYAHCARDQNNFSVRGALTIMIVNNGTQIHKAAFRLPAQYKSVEVRSYILTAQENNTDTYLNNEPLTLESFKPLPKLRRAKILTHLLLTVPAKSIAFFVLPGAKIPICIDNEDDTALILEEIDRIQKVDIADHGNAAEALLSRLNAPRVSVSLADLRRKLEEEFKTDASLLPKLKLKSQMSANNEWKQLADKISQKTEPGKTAMNSVGIKNFNFLLDKAKSDVKAVKPMDFKNLLRKDNAKKDDILGNVLMAKTEKPKPVDMDLNLSSSEVFKILEGRARTKLEKKMGFTDFDFDLDGMLEKALKGKFKRDINMRLLEKTVQEQEQKEQKSVLPKLITKKRKPEKEDISEEVDIEKLPDMLKILPGFEKPSKAKSALSETSIFGNKPLPKLDFFGGADKFDLHSLLSLLGSKATTEPPTTSTTTQKITTSTENVQFLRKPDLYDDHKFDQQFHELEDDLNGGKFFDRFGDSISMHPKKNFKEEELRSGWDFDDAFSNNEYIVNEEDVPRAIQTWEDYFNNGPHSRMNDNFEPAFDSFDDFGRFKRGIRDFIHRIRHRNNENRNSIRRGLNAFRRPRSTEDLVDISETSTPNKIIKEYKSKLDRAEWRPEDILKLPQLHSVYAVDERDDQISFKDIPRSRSSLGLENAERINIRKARRVAGDIDSVENAIDSFFNTIEKETEFIKPLLTKEAGEYTMVLPTKEKLSLLQDKNGDTEIVLHRDAARMNVETESLKAEDKDNQVDDSTCPATDLYPELNLKHLEVLKNAFAHGSTNDGNTAIKHKKHEEDARYDVRHGEPEKRVNRSEYVQKIPLKPRKSQSVANGEGVMRENDNRYNLSCVTNIVNSFSRFMKKLHNKIDTFFKAVE